MGKFGNVFPYEVYVEGVLKKHFQTLGYTVDKGNPYRAEADLILNFESKTLLKT